MVEKNRKLGKSKGLLGGGLVLLCTLMVGCQAVFTFSPLSGLQRDPANLSPEGKISYAQDLLATGSQAEMAEMYTLIDELSQDNPNDPSLHLLAADLALGATGVNEAVEDFLSGGGDVGSATEDIVGDLDMGMVAAAADHVIDAENLGGEISQQQYLNTGVILLGKAHDEANPVPGVAFSDLDTLTSGQNGYDTYIQAKDFIEKGGGTVGDFGI